MCMSDFLRFAGWIIIILIAIPSGIAAVILLFGALTGGAGAFAAGVITLLAVAITFVLAASGKVERRL
jgi:hypothetical protein